MILYFVSLLVFTLASYIAGSFIQIHRSDNLFFQFFLKLFWGSLLLGSIYALIKTGGISVFLILFLLIFYYYVVTGKKILHLKSAFNDLQSKSVLKNLLIIIFILVLTFLLQYFRAFDLAGNQFALHSDFLYYGRLAFFISEQGIENHSFDIYTEIKWAPVIYHYLEIWQTAFIARLFNLNMSLAIYLIIYPFYFSLTILGLLAYFTKSAYSFKPWHLALAAMVLFVSGIGFTDLTKLLSDMYVVTKMETAVYNYPKLAVVTSMIVFIINLEPRPSFKLGFLISVFGLIWPAIIPALFSGYVIWTLILKYCYKQHNFNISFALLTPFVSALLILVFYYFASVAFPKVEIPVETGFLSLVKDFYLSRYGIVSVIYVAVFSVLSFATSVIIYILFFYKGLKSIRISQDFKNLLLLFFLVVTFSIFYYSTFILLFNSWQLYQNISLSVLSVLIIILLFKVFVEEKNKLIRIAGIVLILVNLTTNLILYDGKFSRGKELDASFYISFVDEYEKKDEANFGFFMNYNENMPASYKIPRVSFPGLNTGTFINNLFPVGFSVFDIPVTNDPVFQRVEKSFIKGSIFYQYVLNQKNDDSFIDLETSMMDFAQAHNVRFLFFEYYEQIPEIFRELEHRVLFNESEGFGIMILDEL